MLSNLLDEYHLNSFQECALLWNKQDTAAVLLSAALASKKPEPSNSSFTDVDPVEQGEASNLHDSSSLADNQDLNIQAEPSNHPVTLVEGKVSAFRTITSSIHLGCVWRSFAHRTGQL